MFSNKHILTAIIMAPILAIISYFGVDYVVSERPSAAIPNQSYPLVAKPNCRYESGQCTLKNGDVEVILTLNPIADGRIEIQLVSNLPINGAHIALFSADGDPSPSPMSANNETRWTHIVKTRLTPESKIRMVVSVGEATFYAETNTHFTKYVPTFPQQNWN